MEGAAAEDHGRHAVQVLQAGVVGIVGLRHRPLMSWWRQRSSVHQSDSRKWSYMCRKSVLPA